MRILDNNDGFDNPDDFVLEIPSEPDHYRNCHPQDAPSYFRQLIEKVRSLQLIPNGPSRSDKEFYGYDTGFEDVSIEFCYPELANRFDSAMRRRRYLQSGTAGQMISDRRIGRGMQKRFGIRFNAMFGIRFNMNPEVFQTTF